MPSEVALVCFFSEFCRFLRWFMYRQDGCRRISGSGCLRWVAPWVWGLTIPCTTWGTWALPCLPGWSKICDRLSYADAYLQARIWLPSHATEGGYECVQSRSFWKILHNLCKNRTLWKQNLVLFQKFVVPLPWRLIFVSPKTGHTKLFGGFFCFLCKDTKSLWHW